MTVNESLTLRLTRLTQGAYGTTGVLTFPYYGVPLMTLERPWAPAFSGGKQYGRPNVSRIPAGRYKLSNRYSPSRRDARWYVSDPPHVNVRDEDDPEQRRWGIMFHIANWAHELEGCIALGMATSHEGPDQQLYNSGMALTSFHDSMNRLQAEDRPMYLQIDDHFQPRPAKHANQIMVAGLGRAKHEGDSDADQPA